MKKSDIELLKDPEVRKEIDRYKWIASEREGHDIGQDAADREWIDLYAASWKKRHGAYGRPRSKGGRKSR